MKVNDKIQELRLKIESTLLPEIDNDYILCSLPNYSNIGDMLIYQGTLDFLKKVKYRCIDKCFYNDYHFSHVNMNTIFIIMGGGFWGDIWRSAWESVVKLIEKYPLNKFIILPQSIFYSNKHIADLDAKVLSKNNKILICVRDNDSFVFANKHFKNRITLVPDMAFYMDPQRYSINNRVCDKTLYLKRQDKEFIPNAIDSSEMDERDWPTMDKRCQTDIQKKCEKCFMYYRKLVNRYPKMRVVFKPLVYGIFFSKLYKPLLLGEGVRFINQYQKIYTTRLHGMILSVMMGKETVFLDNSYGKVSSYYKTWLNDIDNLHPIDV